jgi:hypothetical protein
VVVCGIHHSALGDQEIDEGRLPCRRERRHGGKGRRGASQAYASLSLYVTLGGQGRNRQRQASASEASELMSP